MSTSTIDPGDKSPAEIEEDVERTRARVSGTLDSLREKLAPGQMVDEVIERVTDYARGAGGAEFARNLGGAVRDNPLPVLLIGAGIGWLMLSGGSSAPERTLHRISPPQRIPPERGEHSSVVSDAVERVGEMAGAVGDAATRASSYVGDAASRAVEAGSDMISGAKDSGIGASRRAREGWSSASELMETQPLLVGLLGVLAGAALGAVLPRTQAEDDLIGEAADAATARVSQFGRETAEQVRAAAGKHLQDVKNAAAEGYENVKEQLDEGGLPHAGKALGEALSATAKAAGSAASGLAGEASHHIEKAGKPHQEDRNA